MKTHLSTTVKDGIGSRNSNRTPRSKRHLTLALISYSLCFFCSQHRRIAAHLSRIDVVQAIGVGTNYGGSCKQGSVCKMHFSDSLSGVSGSQLEKPARKLARRGGERINLVLPTNEIVPGVGEPACSISSGS